VLSELLLNLLLFNMQVPSFPNDVAMALIESELGKPWQEVYSELTESPIAAGTSKHGLMMSSECSLNFSLYNFSSPLMKIMWFK
jgi:hypothetical protein